LTLNCCTKCTLAGGDDYELLFTAPVARRAAVAAAAQASGTPVTRIGRIEAEPGLRLVDAQGRPVGAALRIVRPLRR
jgi:thiamine-monophosphate kinase